jgi:hypothetical protein
MGKQGTRPDLDRVQPTAIGSPPDSFRLREMASVPDSASVPSAERERGIEKTDELRRLKNARNRKFESISLQQRVRCELRNRLHSGDRQPVSTGRTARRAVGKGPPSLGVCPFTPTRASRPWWSRAARPRLFRDPMTLIRISGSRPHRLDRRCLSDGCGNQARREFDRGFPQGGPDVLDRTALAMSFEAGGDLSQTGLGRRSLVDERVPEIEKEPADLSGRKAQKKMLTFLAKSTFWSRMILRSAIFHEPATRRSRSRRAPT